MKKYFEVIPAVYLIFRRKDEVLLLRRANTGYFDGSYSLPAGHFDGGESATQVAIREAKEEVGANINLKDLKLIHVLHRTSDIPLRHERIDLFFEAKEWEGELINKEPQKCDELRWAEISNLPSNMTPEVKQALHKIVVGETYSELGF